MTILFKNSNKKSTQIRHIWWQIYALLFLFKVLQLDKYGGTDFKYGNKYFQNLLQKYKNKALLVPNLGIFVFSEKFGIRQIWGCFFKIWHHSLKILPKKPPQIRHVWSRIYALLFFFFKFLNLTNLRVLISNTRIVI